MQTLKDTSLGPGGGWYALQAYRIGSEDVVRAQREPQVLRRRQNLYAVSSEHKTITLHYGR